MNNTAKREGSSKVVESEELPLTYFEGSVAKFKERLYTLSYMRNNSIKTTLLLFEPELSINIVVERAKNYCKERSVNFTWIEKSIVDLTKGNEEKI